MGIGFDYLTPVAEYETYLTQFAATRRYDLIITIGFDQVDPVTVVAGFQIRSLPLSTLLWKCLTSPLMSTKKPSRASSWELPRL